MKYLSLFFLPLLASAYKIMSPDASVSKKVVFAGSTQPFQLFDPFQFSSKQERIPFFREAELKHGRLGMISALSIPLIEQVTHQPAIFEFNKLTSDFKWSIVLLMFISEFSSMLKGWEKPWISLFTIKPDYQPGDLGFELTKPEQEEDYTNILNKELNNGRLAMIASLGMIAQELVTHQPLV